MLCPLAGKIVGVPLLQSAIISRGAASGPCSLRQSLQRTPPALAIFDNPCTAVSYSMESDT
jgi:hypothetical protein